MKNHLFAFLCCFPFYLCSQNFTLSGTIKDAQNGEILIGASVYIAELKRSAMTNEFGFYSQLAHPLPLPTKPKPMNGCAR